MCKVKRHVNAVKVAYERHPQELKKKTTKRQLRIEVKEFLFMAVTGKGKVICIEITYALLYGCSTYVVRCSYLCGCELHGVLKYS